MHKTYSRLADAGAGSNRAIPGSDLEGRLGVTGTVGHRDRIAVDGGYDYLIGIPGVRHQDVSVAALIAFVAGGKDSQGDKGEKQGQWFHGLKYTG